MNRTAAFVGSGGGGLYAPLRREEDPYSCLPQTGHSGKPEHGLPR